MSLSIYLLYQTIYLLDQPAKISFSEQNYTDNGINYASDLRGAQIIPEFTKTIPDIQQNFKANSQRLLLRNSEEYWCFQGLANHINIDLSEPIIITGFDMILQDKQSQIDFTVLEYDSYIELGFYSFDLAQE